MINICRKLSFILGVAYGHGHVVVDPFTFRFENSNFIFYKFYFQLQDYGTNNMLLYVEGANLYPDPCITSNGFYIEVQTWG